MPSKSRKRNKGQARKAKAKAIANATINIFEQMSLNVGDIACNLRHGQTETLPDVCNSFMKQFLESFKSSTDRKIPPFHAAMTALDRAYNTYPEAANNDMYRKILKKSIFSNGASCIIGISRLSANETSESILGMKLLLGFATVSMVLDTCAPSTPLPPGTFDERDASTFLRNLDIANGCHRSLVKYFVKHTPCNCLDELYAKIKSTSPKMGVCANCKQRKERTSMFVCTGCERAQYCCKVCQLADAPDHKDECKRIQAGHVYSHVVN